MQRPLARLLLISTQGRRSCHFITHHNQIGVVYMLRSSVGINHAFIEFVSFWFVLCASERAGQVKLDCLRRGAVGVWAELHHNRHLFRPVHHAGISTSIY
jgi:hypothetical protein